MAFDGEKCIELIRNSETDVADLIGAIESLMWHPCQDSCDALFELIMDESHEEYVRKEAAGSLGTLWIEMGVDRDRIKLIPSKFMHELTADFKLNGVDYEKDTQQ